MLVQIKGHHLEPVFDLKLLFCVPMKTEALQISIRPSWSKVGGVNYPTRAADIAKRSETSETE